MITPIEEYLTTPQEEACALLRANPNYKVLKKLIPENDFKWISYDDLKYIDALIVGIIDTETTGTNFEVDAIVELGIVKVAFEKSTYKFIGVLGVVNEFEEPSVPMSEEAFLINGITPDLYTGKFFPEQYIEEFCSDIQLLIAHNAYFDRPFIEKRFNFLTNKYWGCSQKEISWLTLGVTGVKLEFIAYSLDFFYESHRAVNDCFALLNALLIENKSVGLRAIDYLFNNVKQKSYRIWALGAPYSKKGLLRARNYNWEPEPAKCWYFMANSKEAIQKEFEFLTTYVYETKMVSLPVDVLTSKNRYSKTASFVTKELDARDVLSPDFISN